MKRQSWLLLLITTIAMVGIAFLWHANREHKKEISNLEKELFSAWDNRIADYQFSVNVTYRNSDNKKIFFDSLDASYAVLRKLTKKAELEEADKRFLKNFITVGMKKVGLRDEEILNRVGVQSADSLFIGNKLEVIKRLDRILNPNFMTQCRYFQDFDIWEKQDKWHLTPGDTTILMIRLLKNYDLYSHQLELIPSDNLKVIQPYLGELTVIMPDNMGKEELFRPSFKLYDWINQDTIVQEFSFE